MDLKLKNKVVIVTGSTSGIGESIAYAFAKEGAIPVIIGRNEPKGSEIVERIGQEYDIQTLFIQAQLSQAIECKKVVDRTLDRFGKIDIVINNAGANDTIGLDASPEEFMKSLERNLMHYYAIVHFAKSSLIESKGNIINIGSKVANTGQGKTSGYAAAKGGVQALTREWAVDLLPYGIRVNEVIPAEAWTASYDKWINTFDNPQEKLKSITDKIPLGRRMTTSEELAAMVVFIASQQSSHTTGQHIYVDGGYTHLDRTV